MGLNLGAVAGGSLADHLHQHVVPRWGGDANFIAVIGQTKVIPQLLSETRRLLAEAWPEAAADEAARAGSGGSDTTSPGTAVVRTSSGLLWTAHRPAPSRSRCSTSSRERTSAGSPTPVGRWLVARGVSPDAVTVAGTVGTAAAAVWFIPRGQLFLGALLATVFVLFDMIDGAMARARGFSTPFGAVLDSVCDRIADGVLFAAITWWCLASGQQALGVAALVCLVAGQVISYIKARAEGAGLTADGGLVERPERLIASLVGTGFEGLGIPFALATALWLLAAASVWTVGQRIVAVHRSARELAATQARGTVT